MKNLGKFLCAIGQIAAVLLVIGLLVQYIDNCYGFIPPINGNSSTTILDLIVKYGITLVVGIIALGASMKAHPILMIIVALVIAGVVGFMFYGDAINVFLPKAKDAAAIVSAIIA
ncbi:MAG: hypothetical protein K2K04_02725 [Clostridia bacterium]|nr:hypothetical protein [Clostridia bacterium]